MNGICENHWDKCCWKVLINYILRSRAEEQCEHVLRIFIRNTYITKFKVLFLLLYAFWSGLSCSWKFQNNVFRDLLITVKKFEYHCFFDIYLFKCLRASKAARSFYLKTSGNACIFSKPLLFKILISRKLCRTDETKIPS